MIRLLRLQSSAAVTALQRLKKDAARMLARASVTRRMASAARMQSAIRLAQTALSAQSALIVKRLALLSNQ
jgi:hypothetical protein